MASGPSSRASVWARWISAAFAAAYCARGCGFMPEIDAISTAAPPPRARRCGRAARMSTAGWTTLRAIVCSQSAAVVSSRAGPPAAPPALATTRSRPPSSRAHSSTAAVSAASSVTSAATPCAPTPSVRSSPADALHLIGVARAQPHGAALVGQAQDDRPADPARGARDEGDLAGEPEVHQTWVAVGGGGAGRRRRRRGHGRSRRHGLHLRAALRPGLVGKPDDRRADVVGLVGLPDPVAGVGAVHDREAAAQARDLDPVVGIGRGIDVGPAHGCPEGDLAGVRTLIARAEEAVAADRGAVAHAVEVAQAVVVLGPGAHQPGAMPGRIDGPQLEARRVVELPVGPSARGHGLEVQLGLGRDPAPPPRGVDDHLLRPHLGQRDAPAEELRGAGADVDDPVLHAQHDVPPARAALDAQVARRRHDEVRAAQRQGRVVAWVGNGSGERRQGGGGCEHVRRVRLSDRAPSRRRRRRSDRPTRRCASPRASTPPRGPAS